MGDHMERSLYRSRNDRMLAGVCGGLAEYFSVDPTLIRVATVLLGIVTQGGVMLAYIIMAVVVPEEPLGGVEPARSGEQGGVLVSDMNESQPQDSGIPKAPDVVVPAPETVSEPANAPSPAPPTPTWTAPVAPPREHRSGIGFGIVLIVLGGLLLANQFIPGVNLWRFWPLIIIALGVSALFKGARR